jgi:hypothetical protein
MLSSGGHLAYTVESPGLRRTTIYTYPDDRARLAELVRQMSLSDPDAQQPYTNSEAIRIAVEYMLSYAFEIEMGGGPG